MDEYFRASEELSAQFHGIDLDPALELLTTKTELIEAALLDEPVCDDPDDDKFFACAIVSGANLIEIAQKDVPTCPPIFVVD